MYAQRNIATHIFYGTMTKNGQEEPVRSFVDYLYLRLRAASDFFLRFTEGFS